MSSWYGGEFDAILRCLRKSSPTELPCSVRTVDEAAMDALQKFHQDEEYPWLGVTEPMFMNCDKVRNWRISIARGLDMDLANETLIHEWAHCIDQEKNGLATVEYHRRSWGEEYARIYKTIHGKGN